MSKNDFNSQNEDPNTAILEVMVTAYNNARGEDLEDLNSADIATIAKRLDEVDLYTLALINYFDSSKSGRNGINGTELKAFFKERKFLFGERLIFISLGRLEIIGAIEYHVGVSRLRTYRMKINGLNLDFLLYEVNERYKQFSDEIINTFENIKE